MDISFYRDPVGQPGVGSFTRDFERQMKEGCGNEASVSMGALWGESEGYVEEGSGDGRLSP